MKIRFFSALIATLLVAPFFAASQSAEELRNQISTHTTKIETLNKEIAEYERQLTEIGGKKQTLQSTLNSLDISRKQLTARMNVTKNSIESLQLELQALDGSIDDKEQSISTHTAGLAQAINQMNEVDNVTLAEQLFGEGGLSSLWNELETNYAFQDAVTNHIQSLETARENLIVDREETEKKKAELEKQRKKLVSEQTSLDINRREQQSLLSQTKSQESNYQKLLKDKQAAKIAFEQSLNELESKLEYTMDPTRLPTAGKGILRWPLDSVKVTQDFGDTAFARSGAYAGKGHNGIDLRAPIGTPIRAALSGRIEGTGNSDQVRGCYSYGKWVLIKHSNGLTTLYAHLSQVGVTEGQEVYTGDVIGYSGNTGYATGPHLHFSVYASNGVRVMKLGQSTGKKTPCANATIPVAPYGAYLNPMNYL